MDDNEASRPSMFDIRNLGVFLFPYEVDEESCAEACEFILRCNMEDQPPFDHITLIVNSPGGSVTDGFALIDFMRGSRMPVHTVGVGMLASMGLMIFIAGKKGYRVLTPNTLILSHQWSGISWGKEHELVAARKKNDLITNMVMRHYKTCTGMKEKEIRSFLLPPEDMWLSADEALKYGLCDEIKDISGG